MPMRSKSDGQHFHDTEEARDVLSDAAYAPAVVALADGWPALISLASRFSGEMKPDSDMQDALFDYFARELFGNLDAAVQRSLVLLAVQQPFDRPS